MDQKFSSRKEAEGQSQWYTISIGRSDQRNTTGQCLGIHPICHVHKWPPGHDQQYGTHLLPMIPTVYTRVASDDDRAKLQEDINSLVQWSDTWQLRFNADKCKVLQLVYNNSQYTYDMAGVEIQSTPFEKDLGVYIDKFHDHVAHAVSKWNRMLGLIKNRFSCLDEETISKLYKSLVRPHLEYGNVIWHPRFEMDKIAVEKVEGN